MKKPFIVLTAFFLSSGIVFSQESQIIDEQQDSISNIKIDVEDNTILTMIDGLINTPIYENSDRIANLTQVFIQWVIETDKVKVEILPYFTEIVKTNNALSIPFLCGWVLYSQRNGWNKNDFPLEENIAAVTTVIEYYRKNEARLLKDSYILDLESKLRNEELSNYLKNKIEESKNQQEDIKTEDS